MDKWRSVEKCCHFDGIIFLFAYVSWDKQRSSKVLVIYEFPLSIHFGMLVESVL